jgi:hypothetical protein
MYQSRVRNGNIVVARLFSDLVEQRNSGGTVVHARMAIGTIILPVALVTTLYDVKLNFVFSLPGEVEQIDLAQEALYTRCYKRRDEEIHDTAFGTIDNPDVQKEFINTSRAQAASACRDEYPQQWQTVRQPFALKLLDLQPRYW